MGMRRMRWLVLSLAAVHVCAWVPPLDSLLLQSRALARSSSSRCTTLRMSLYQDQQAAMIRRAEQERQWLEARSVELLPPILDAKKQKKLATASRAGGGFGAGASKKATSSTDASAKLLAAELKREGVVRIDGALSAATAESLRKFVLQQRDVSKKLVEDGGAAAEDCFGVELERGGGLRFDLLLPLPPVVPALAELLGPAGRMGAVLEQVCGKDAHLYELCSLITEPGSPRQTIHPDTPFQKHCPLYAVFVALQDVTNAMGPTTFIPGSHTEEQSKLFASVGQTRDDILKHAKAHAATMKAGDAVIFDSRVLHAGTANLPKDQGGGTRAIFNVSFRNVKANKGPMGYKGSIRPGYEANILEATKKPPLTLASMVRDLETNQVHLTQLGDGLRTAGVAA